MEMGDSTTFTGGNGLTKRVLTYSVWLKKREQEKKIYLYTSCNYVAELIGSSADPDPLFTQIWCFG